MNSVATLISVDFYEKFAKNPTQAKSVRLAEWMTVVAGVIGVGTALILSQINIQSALDKSWELLGLLGGGFAGCYGLGMFTRRANWQGAIVGVIGSLIITFACWRAGLVNPVFYQPLAIGGCLLVGYVASYFFPPPQQSLAGLTIFDRKKST
jgi:Na+/proline symporter